jgi:hypothetical protein
MSSMPIRPWDEAGREPGEDEDTEAERVWGRKAAEDIIWIFTAAMRSREAGCIDYRDRRGVEDEERERERERKSEVGTER